MLRKLLATTAALLFTSIGVATAQEGGSNLNPTGIAASDTTPVVGQVIELVSTGWAPGSSQDTFVESDPIFVGRSTADATGRARLSFTMPKVAPGEHHIVARGTGADGQPLVQRVRIMVEGATTGGANLPKTGSDSSLPMAQIGAGAVAVGGLLVLVARKRRSSASSAA